MVSFASLARLGKDTRLKRVERIVHTGSGRGTIEHVIRRNDAWLQTFSSAKRNKIIKAAMLYAGKKWRARYLHLRFRNAIVRSPPFNYRLKPGSRSPLRGRRLDDDPKKLMNAVFRGKIKATKRQGGDDFVVKIPLPFGHAVRPEIAATLLVVPSNELEQVAEWVSEYFVAATENASGIASLSVGRTIKPRRTPVAERRRQRDRIRAADERRAFARAVLGR